MLARSRTSEGWQVEASGLWPIVCLCGERETNCGMHGPMHMSLHDVVPEEHGKGTRTQSVSYIQHPSHCLNYKMKMQTASGNTRARVTSPASPSSSIEDGHLPSVTSMSSPSTYRHTSFVQVISSAWNVLHTLLLLHSILAPHPLELNMFCLSFEINFKSIVLKEPIPAFFCPE